MKVPETNNKKDGGNGKFVTPPQAREYFKRHDRSHSVPEGSKRAQSLAWNCTGSMLACGSDEKTVLVWAAESGCRRMKMLLQGQGHNDLVDQVAWSWTNSELLASASGDKSIRTWDLRQKRSVMSLATKASNINVTWSPCGDYLVYGDRDEKLHVVDYRTHKVLHSESLKKDALIGEFVYDPSGQFLFVCAGHGKVYIFRMPEMKTAHVIQAHPSGTQTYSVKIDPTGRHFATGATDALCSIWDFKDLVCLRSIDRDTTKQRRLCDDTQTNGASIGKYHFSLDWPVRAVSFSYDGRIIAAGSEDHVIDIAWVDTGERVHCHKVDAEVLALAWHPHRHVLALSAGSDVQSVGGGYHSGNSSSVPVGVRVFGFND